jgi:hypothetical protein
MAHEGGLGSGPEPPSSLSSSSPPAPPAPPAPRVTVTRFAFDGAFIGPILPPAAPPAPVPPAPAPARVTAEVLAIPLGIRDLLRQALDLLTRSDNGLRAASFYIGLMMLVTVGPAVVLLGVGLVEGGDRLFDFDAPAMDGWVLWMMLAAIPAYLGYIGAATEARAMATAVIGGRVEGRPLRLRESIAVSRRRFWRVLGVQLAFGLLSTAASLAVGVVLFLVMGPVLFINDGISLLIALAVGIPFVYAPAGIVLGEVGMADAVARSFRLVRARKRLAVVIALFAVFGQFIVLFGLSAGIDLVARVVEGSGMTEDFPSILVVPIAAATVFALGTLTFLVEAIAAAPAVHAFEALTHYTDGLEIGRRAPVAGHRPWDPWFTRGLLACAVTGFIALVGGLLSLG